jgi:heme-degrading monooxygenase HmoA
LAVIVRHWRGVAKADRANEYESHLRAETLPALRRLAGFLGAEVLRRRADDGVEFLVITRWASIAAIARFAGADAEAAVVPAKVHAMMVEFDARARHYEMASESANHS